MPTSPDPLPLAALDDARLVARIRAGETALFELVMRRNNQSLYRALRAVLKDETEVEDALQDCYLRAYSRLDQFEGRSALSTWLIRIGVNLAVDRLRKKHRIHLVAPEEIEASSLASLGRREEPGPEEQRASRELAVLLSSAVDALPMPYRTVFVLREVEGMDTKQTAACLGIAENTVKTRLRRSRERLRQELFERAGASVDELYRFGGERCDRLVGRVLDALAAA